jgi:hypothetical protein
MPTSIRREVLWECPRKCGVMDKTSDPRPHVRMHTCRAFFGMTAPLVQVGSRVHVEAHEREDYVGTERVQLDGRGRPIMNITTTRPDGSNDVIVFAPLATGSMRS